jgi:hypothetical protein
LTDGAATDEVDEYRGEPHTSLAAEALTATHRRTTTEEQIAAMVAMGMPETVAEANARALALFAAGDADWVTDDVPRITGRPARSFAQCAADQAGRFTATQCRPR